MGNTEKLFLSSCGEFGKICGKTCDQWYLLWPHAKIYHCLWAASPLSSVQIEWNGWGKWWESWWCRGDLKMRSGNRTHHCGVCSANQDVKHLFCSLRYICRGMIWICILQYSSGPSLVVNEVQVVLWVLNFEKYWLSTELPALSVFVCLLIFVAWCIKENFGLCTLCSSIKRKLSSPSFGSTQGMGNKIIENFSKKSSAFSWNRMYCKQTWSKFCVYNIRGG